MAYQYKKLHTERALRKTERPGASGLQKTAKGCWIQTQNVRTLGGKWNLNATVVTIEQNI